MSEVLVKLILDSVMVPTSTGTLHFYMKHVFSFTNVGRYNAILTYLSKYLATSVFSWKMPIWFWKLDSWQSDDKYSHFMVTLEIVTKPGVCVDKVTTWITRIGQLCIPGLFLKRKMEVYKVRKIVGA